MLTGIIFGLMPALRATRVDLSGAMKEGGRSVTGSRTVLSKGLVVLQVAMSLVLLVGAGLFLRTLSNLESVDVGFDSRNLLMFNVNPRVNGYDLARSSRLFGQVLERMGTVAGVRSAALTRAPLLSATTFVDPTWKQARRRAPGRRDHVQDGRLAGVLRDDGNSRPAGSKLHRSGRPGRAQGGDPQ